MKISEFAEHYKATNAHPARGEISRAFKVLKREEADERQRQYEVRTMKRG
jgi:hypothetical protein